MSGVSILTPENDYLLYGVQCTLYTSQSGLVNFSLTNQSRVGSSRTTGTFRTPPQPTTATCYSTTAV